MKEQVFYRDKQLKGFALRVTGSGVKSFIVETRIPNKVKRITLSKFGQLTAEEGRKQAKHVLGQIAKGDNPIAEMTLGSLNLMTADTELLRKLLFLI